MIKVFYDGKCGLCSKEINYYRRIAPIGVFDWHDVTESYDDLKKEGISLSEALRMLHVKDEKGVMHIGVDAFIIIWKQLSWWKILAAFVSLPIISHLANLLYRYFADWRFKRLEHCKLAEKKEE